MCSLRIRPVHVATIESILTGCAGQAAVFVSGIVVSRMLGLDYRGNLALLVLLPTVIAQVGSLGLPIAATFFIARAPGTARQVSGALATVALSQAAILTVLHAIVILALVPGDERNLRVAAVLTLPATPASLAQQYGLAILQGRQQFTSFNVLRLASPAVYSVAVLVSFLTGGAGLGTVVGLWSASLALVAAATIAAAHRELRRSPSTDGGPSRGALVRFGIKALVGAASPTETFRLDQALVGLLLPPAALGLYATGLAFTNLPKFIVQSIGMIAYPYIAVQSDQRAARRAAMFFVASATALCVGVVALLSGAAAWLVPFFFGQEFGRAVTVTRILLLSALLVAVRRILTDAVKGLGDPSSGSLAEIVAWLVLVVGAVASSHVGSPEQVSLLVVVSSAASLAVIGALTVRTVRRQWTYARSALPRPTHA